MAVIKVLTQSDTRGLDATQRALAKAAETVHNSRSTDVSDRQAMVDNNRIVGNRVKAKIAFVLD